MEKEVLEKVTLEASEFVEDTTTGARGRGRTWTAAQQKEEDGQQERSLYWLILIIWGPEEQSSRKARKALHFK